MMKYHVCKIIANINREDNKVKMLLFIIVDKNP